VSRYITELQAIKPKTSGHDLQRMGIKPGPKYKKILDRLHQATLDGEATNRHDEQKIIEKEFL